MILFNKTEIWTKLLISRQSPKKGLKCFLYVMLFSLFRCSNVYGKHCIYIFLCLRKFEIENLPYLWNVLSMKCPIYEMSCYEMSFYEMSQHHLLSSILCILLNKHLILKNQVYHTAVWIWVEEYAFLEFLYLMLRR